MDGKGGISFIRSLEDGKWMAVELLGSGKGSVESSGSFHDGVMEASKLVSASSCDDTSVPKPPPSAAETSVIPGITPILRRQPNPSAPKPLRIRLLSASATQSKVNLKTEAIVAQQLQTLAKRDIEYGI